MITGNAYREAIQNPHLNLADSELKRGEPVLDPLGLPRAVSGNFASVFTMVCGSRRYAVKCFFSPHADQLKRYQAIHEYLHSVERPWEVEFEFQPKGIRIAGTWHPIVKMEWIEATRLDRYVQAQLGTREAVSELATRFAGLVSDLRDCGIAHGDLQHGNILVTPDGQLRLVDYDGMYVPALRGMGSHELGHPNYQHPARSHLDFDVYVDNFSSWVIYVSLIALSIDPSIWARVNAGEEQLVFNRQDFEATIYSSGFGALQMTGNPQLADLAAEMKRMLGHQLRDLPELMPIELHLSSAPTVAFTASTPQTIVAETSGSGVLPDWMPLTAKAVANSGASRGPGLEWMVGQLPNLPTMTFGAVGSAAKRLIQGMLIWVAILAALGIARVIAVSVDIFTGVIVIALGIGVEALLYLRTPEGAKRRKAEQLLVRQRRSTREAEGEVERLAKETAKLDASEGKEIEKLDREATQVRAKEQEKLTTAQKSLQSRVGDVAKKRLSLQQEEQTERANALKDLQKRVYENELARHNVEELRLSSSIKAGLRLLGMRSAADIRGSSGEYVVRADGATLKIRGVGPAKADMIGRWVIDVQNRARALQPQALPNDVSAGIQQKYAARLQALGIEEQQARQAAQTEAEAIRAASQQEQLQLVARGNAIRVGNAQARDSLRQAFSLAGQTLTDRQWKYAQATRELEACSKVTFPRFLARAALSR
jgi:hypothetical protein